MLTAKGESILRDLFTGFRDEYVRRNPGCNENDIERAFLCDLSIVVHGSLSQYHKDLIEQIQ